MNSSIKSNISRLSQLNRTLTDLDLKLANPSLSSGAKLALNREKVFLREKVTHTLKNLKQQVQPDFIYEVTINEYEYKFGSYTKYIQLVIANSEDEVRDYFKVVEMITRTSILITDIIKKPTTTKL